MQKQIVINIDSSINSGQVFLWEKIHDRWYGVNGKDVLAFDEKSFKLNSFAQNSLDFFREDDDFEKIIHSITKDRVVREAVELFPGLRLFRQDPFQCYISFIASSNSNIQNIRKSLQLLCKKFGKDVIFEEKKFCLFPEPETLSNATISDIQKCGFGYRAKSIKDASLAVTSGQIDFGFLKKTNYQNAKDILLEIYGIGNKVADCILLFSLDKLDAFPIDRWILKILEKYYSDKFPINGKSLTEKKYNQIHEKIVNHFGPYAGYSQQFLFKMEREINQKSWL
ncbi:MAG TPA: DNA glycosylase [Nitrosopumilaceae archaeon]|nr:DNA glycosylase [Nitrosopumilaceae archaeon]